MTSRNLVHALCLCVTAVAASPGSAADEDDVLDEVLVTATLRAERPADLAASVTVLSAPQLARAGVQHFEDVLGLVPNLNWSAGTARPRYFQLRGVGELEQYQGAPNPSVGFLIDDIDFSGIAMPATLFDVGQVEVLRGPQGTAYGANALGGLVSVRTREATPEFELRGEATVGDYGARALGAVVGGPVSAGDEAAWRLVAQQFRSDGFRRNVTLGRDDTNGFDELTTRAKFHAVRGALTFDATALHADVDDGYDAFAVDNSRVTRSDKPGRDAQRSDGAAMRLTYSGFERVLVRSVTTYADSDITYSFDGDWAASPDYDFTSRFLRNRRTISQELRLTSVDDADAGFSWIAGAYALDAREDNDQLDLFDGNVFRTLVSRYDATNVAVYGQVDVPVGERGALSVGVRGEHRDARYRDTDGSAFSPGETMWGGHLSYEVELAPDRRAYAVLARGYKAGGFSIGALVPTDRREFRAEFLTNVEAGLKLRAADGRLDANVALFYMRRTDQQVATSFQLDPLDPLTFVFLTDNAARGENYGLEGALRWRATSRLDLGATLGLLETRYIGYRFGDRDLDGREQAHAPQYQYSLSAEWREPRGLLARVDLQGVDNFYFDASHDEKSRPYAVVNLKIGYENDRWSALAWVRNAFDAEYAMRGFFFGNEPPDFLAKRYVQPGDPRQIGVTLRYTWR